MQSVEAECVSGEERVANVLVDATTCGVPLSAPNVEPASSAALRGSRIKFTTDSSGLALALASPMLQRSAPDAPGRSLTSVYFDTPSGDLKSQGMVLRVRRAGRSAPVMTLKWKLAETGDLLSCGQIEVRTRGLTPDLNQFDETVAARLKAIIGHRPLNTQFETRIKRRTRLLKVAASEIEVTFDEGVIVAGESSWPVSDVEFELKSGEAVDLYEFGVRLAESLPVKLDATSKSARAFALAANATPTVVKAGPLKFQPNAVLDEAVAVVMNNTLNHFVSNWAALRDGGDPESIHQMRVSLRRLRAALAMFKRTLPCPEFDAFRAEAKRIASALGPARECDAFRELVEAGPMSHFGAKANFAPLMSAFEERRCAAYRDARALIDAPQSTIFVLKMHAFLARRGWRNALSGQELARLTEPAEVFAAHALERLHKRATKRGRNLVILPDDQRHEVRIALKNLRYASEFFGAFFANSRRVRAYVRSTAHLQDLLGAHNDAASVEGFLKVTPDADAARAAGIVIGWYGRGATMADAGLKAAWQVFKKTKRFWR